MKAAIVLIILSLVLVACSPPLDAPPAASSIYSVTYKVTGTASKASLTYKNAQGGTEQMKVDVPWERTFNAERGAFLYISAQNEGKTGTVGCEIRLDGTKWKEATSSGAYVIATCNGTAGRD